MTVPNPIPTTVKDRLASLLDVVLQDSRLNKAFIPMIRTLAKSFLADMADAQIMEGISKLRDELIPWVLGEVQSHEDTHQT